MNGGMTDDERRESVMNTTFALADGTCAGLILPDGLQNEAIGMVDVPCSEKDVSVVFHVANNQSLGRVMRRFGTVKN
jgi:hypothetical protein